MSQHTQSVSDNGQRHAELMASNWATLAITEGRDARSSSIIMQASATKDAVERRRLGLAMMLDSQMSDQDTVGEIEEYSGNAVGNGHSIIRFNDIFLK